MICFKLNKFITSFERSLFLIVKKNVLKYKDVSTILGRTNSLFFLNHNTLKFNVKRYFKLVYKTLKTKKKILFLNIEKNVIKLGSTNSFFRVKKPHLLVFIKSKETNLMNECKKYNIPVLNF